MYPQPVSAGTRVDIVYHPAPRRIGDVNYTGRLYIQLPGDDVKPAGLQYPPAGSAPLIPDEGISILFEVRVVNADTGAETGNDYTIAADQKPDAPELATWNFTDTDERAGGTVEFKFQSAVHRREQVDKYTSLINGQYNNKIQLIQQVGGLNVNISGPNLVLNNAPPMQWNLVVASWNSSEPGYGYLNGYWIYRTDGLNMCWKLDHDYTRRGIPYFDGLTLWNYNGQAVGTPQDYELFNFVGVDAAASTVKIKQAFGGFVGLDNEILTCNAAVQANPGIFVVNFL